MFKFSFRKILCFLQQLLLSELNYTYFITLYYTYEMDGVPKMIRNNFYLHHFTFAKNNIVVFYCTTKEVFKTKYGSCSQMLFLVLK